MNSRIFLGILIPFALCACVTNEIIKTENLCTNPLRQVGTRRSVSLESPMTGQLSLFRHFTSTGDSLVFTEDTLFVQVGALYEDGFEIIEHECPENFLAPDPPLPNNHLIQRQGAFLRTSGFSVLLPYDYEWTLPLYPTGAFLEFHGVRPPPVVIGKTDGKILNFSLGKLRYDTVAVRLDAATDQQLHYWVYTAKDGPLLAAQADASGHITGWVRAEP